MAYLNLIRYPNLLIILLTQILLRYAFFEPLHIDVFLNDFDYSLLILATLCLTAAGNVINDINDIDADLINKPDKRLIGEKISIGAGYYLFIILNVVGVCLGFYLSNTIGKPSFAAIFVAISGVLYLYATYLKHLVLIGNLIISILVSLVILIVAVYDIMPAVTVNNEDSQHFALSIMMHYALFAFGVNLIRELVKDQEDIKGDYNVGTKSLPIVLGRSRTNTIIGLLTLALALSLVYYIKAYLYINRIAVLYVILVLLGPLFYVMTKIWNAEQKKTYHNLSNILKGVMLFGLSSIGLYQFILN